MYFGLLVHFERIVTWSYDDCGLLDKQQWDFNVKLFIYRNNKALESCGNARNSLQSTLQRIRPEG